MSHETKLTSFMSWAAFPRESDANSSDDAAYITCPSYVVQIVKQVNLGPLESKRYFAHNASGSGNEAFIEIPEKWLIHANLQKLNTLVP